MKSSTLAVPLALLQVLVKSALRLYKVLSSDSFSIDTFVSGGCSGDVATYFDVARQRSYRVRQGQTERDLGQVQDTRLESDKRWRQQHG